MTVQPPADPLTSFSRRFARFVVPLFFSNMKPTHLVPPVLALVAAGWWIGTQRRSISMLELESEALRGRLEFARQGPATATADPSFAGQRNANSKAARTGSKVDWKKVAATQAAMKSGGGGEMRAFIALRNTLLDLSADELLAGFDEIAALDLPDDVKRRLERTLIGVLAVKDPQAALGRFSGRINGGDGDWELSNAFQSWSAKDATAAAAWMDAQVEAGTFENKRLDGRNDPRIQFEAGLIQHLAASDPAGAARRLAALPEDQRDEIFTSRFHFRIRPGTEKAVADLIRTQVAADERLSTLGRSSAPLVKEGYGKVGEFLGAIDASAEERAAVVGEALRERFKGQDEMTTSAEETRAWILAQAPADAERLSGEALAHLSEWLEFPEMAQEALKYQQASGNDDALVAFLKFAPEKSRDEILELAGKINDPAKRAEVEARFINNPNHPAAPASTGP